MASNLGPGVSRVLDPNGREFLEVILQQGKPPMDAEFNLLQELATDITRKAVVRGCPSGWLGNETNTLADYVTSPQWSNWFRFGTQRAGEKQSVMWAVVNGWLVPVTGTRTGTPPGSPNDTDTWNLIALDPPPSNSGDFRTDFVFLEVWQARVSPNPSATNKPSSSALFRYGNVEGGQSYLPDDLIDPALGFETSQRVQLQYRIRVVKGILGLSSYPDGFDPSVVKAKGAFDPTNPDTATAFTFQNMRSELGDAGLWRAGDGTSNNLGTVDGYVYAIPLCGVFRRNSVVWTGDPFPNLNGGFSRNPTAVDRSGVKTFSTVPTLASPITATSVSLTLVSGANTPLPATPATPVYIRVGGEVMQYTSVTGNTVGGLIRGVAVAGTVAEPHAAGDVVEILSGRPDGLFADQVAQTDILDLRHLVNPNGFDYNTLLRYNFDKLLKGELRANWKRSNGGTQGPFVFYQDKLTSGGTPLGITKLDAPDNIRMVFSDAITAQPIEVVLSPVGGGGPTDVGSGLWDLSLSAIRQNASPGDFAAGDIISFPVAQLKAGLAAGALDQVRWANEGQWVAEIRIDGQNAPIDPSCFVVTPASLTSADDLTITLQASFPTSVASGKQLYVRLYALYGAGRGISRRPDAVHSVELLNPSSNILHTPFQFPSGNYRLSSGYPAFWSKFVGPFSDAPILPITAESYVDHGSKTVILQPFRQIVWPTNFVTLDGTAANPNSTFYYNSNTGNTSGVQIVDTSGTIPGVAVKDACIIRTGTQQGRYTVTAISTTVAPNDTLILDRVVPTDTGIQFELRHAQGLMPVADRTGAAKWTTTDPLELFAGSTDTTHTTTQNLYVTMPDHLVPYAGEVWVPVLAEDAVNFDEGVNYMFRSLKNAGVVTDGDKNYVPYDNGSYSYGIFTTVDLTQAAITPPVLVPAPYNTSLAFNASKTAGIRQFTDPRGLGRTGLQLPPFYGVARLFGVYEAVDYAQKGSPFDAGTRERNGLPAKATNLLRQSWDGPTFWIEVDADGDATFILNSAAIDISRSPNAIANFASGNYVIEASLFGFDRDTFSNPPNDLGPRECRFVLTRVTGSANMRTQANNGVRAANINITIAGPTSVLPGPLPLNQNALVNFSRTPYGGDAWGTQTNNIDLQYNPGPLQSATAYNIESIRLNQNALTRPNQKPFEILACLPFATTAGTGRIGGAVETGVPVADAGYEAIGGGVYPPSSAIAPRPNFATGALLNEMPNMPYLSKYNGCTERLPMGALWRDKDFRAVTFTPWPGHTQLTGFPSVGMFAGLARSSNLEARNIVALADGNSEPGTVMVQVDGEQVNYGANTNFRTFRGGSAFTANGDNPGGYFGPGYMGVSAPVNPYTNVLAGTAYLVRNAPTNKGAAEVSAGGELMMVVVTQMQRSFGATGQVPSMVQLSTTGWNEGYAALDYYRIEGHPLIQDNIRVNIDPATIALTRDILPRH